MPSTRHNIRLIESLETRLGGLKYQDYTTLNQLATEVRIVIRRVFGDEHVYAHDFELIRFEPKGFIANSDNYLMTGAWNEGQTRLAELLRAMKTELAVYGKKELAGVEITIPWLLKNMPWEVWTVLSALVVGAFTLGVTLAHTTFVEELLAK